jgi:predicted O-linked N-acetylglucosamine transferase (SPINDLY family)
MSIPSKQVIIDQTMQKAYGFHQQGDLSGAEKLYQQVLQFDPKHSDANRLLGVIAFDFGRYQEAIQFLNKAISVKPKFFQNHFILGGVHKKLFEMDKAIACYKKCIALKPDFIEAYNNLGLIYKSKKMFSDAIICYQNALKYQPDSSFTWSNLGNALKETGRMAEALQALEKSLSIDPKFSAAYSNYLMALNYGANNDLEFIYQQHTKWKNYCPSSLSAKRFEFKQRGAKSKLKIAYISPDFHTHSVAYFIEPLLKAHNKESVELFGYYNNSVFDQTNERIQSYFDHWRNISEMSVVAVADKIFEDEIDILVDLAGHSANNSLTVLYQKPAPIQVTWLGYPNTTGLNEIDYRITDSLADPEGKADALHSENLFRLEKGFLCYQGDNEVPVQQDIPYDRNGYFTFGSFNNYVKVTPEVISVWAQILNEVPKSKLILKSSQFADKDTKGRCIKLFKKQGIAKERLNLVAMLPKSNDHMSFYGELDLALDPFPYNGTTTTFEALWMGVPTLTLSGNRHASRVGESILSRVGLESYVSHNEKDYINLARLKSESLDELRELRTSLRENMICSPLCDQKSFAQQMESAYQYMWEKYLQQTT